MQKITGKQKRAAFYGRRVDIEWKLPNRRKTGKSKIGNETETEVN